MYEIERAEARRSVEIAGLVATDFSHEYLAGNFITVDDFVFNYNQFFTHYNTLMVLYGFEGKSTSTNMSEFNSDDETEKIMLSEQIIRSMLQLHALMEELEKMPFPPTELERDFVYNLKLSILNSKVLATLLALFGLSK